MTDPWCCYINGSMDPINIPQMLAYVPYMDPMGYIYVVMIYIICVLIFNIMNMKRNIYICLSLTSIKVQCYNTVYDVMNFIDW